MGYFKRCCWGQVASYKDPANVTEAVTAASTQLSLHPRLEVTVKGTYSTCAARVMVIADTGAIVSMAGTMFMQRLGLKTRVLRECRHLRDVMNILLQCLGSAFCYIIAENMSTKQEVYFVHSARTLYLSLGACKGFSLVPEDYPLHTQLLGAACSESIHGGVSHQVSPKPTEVPFFPLEEHFINHLQHDQVFPSSDVPTTSTLCQVLPHTPVTSLQLYQSTGRWK